MKKLVNAYNESKIPYTLVSMAAILRDYADMSDWYKNDLHKQLTDIADSLYNVGIDPDEFKAEYKELYDQYGKAYFDKVLDDMYALDGQLTSDAKVQELIQDYEDRLSGVTASTKVTATEDNSYNQHLVQVSKEDKQYVLNDLNKSHKTVGMGGAGDPGYYVSEFEPAYGLYLWASDTGLRILDENGIEYTEVKKAVGASTKVSASDNPFYDKLSDYDKRIVDNQRKQFSPLTFDVYNALLPYIGEYSSNTGWTGSCELMKVKDNNTADGYLYKVIWDDGHDVDVFSWQINDNPRVGGDFTLMVMPAHGMPDFCDSEKDFYRAVRKVFGDGLKKIN